MGRARAGAVPVPAVRPRRAGGGDWAVAVILPQPSHIAWPVLAVAGHPKPPAPSTTQRSSQHARGVPRRLNGWVSRAVPAFVMGVMGTSLGLHGPP